jgi:hypothetical protein
MSDETVEIAVRHSRAKRLALGVTGLFVLVWPVWDLWPGIASANLVTPIFWIIGLGSAALGAVLLAAAILGKGTVLTVAPSGLLLREEDLLRVRQRRLAPQDIGPVAVTIQEWSDGPASFRVSLARRGEMPLLSEAFATRGEAEALAERLRLALQRPGRA